MIDEKERSRKGKTTQLEKWGGCWRIKTLELPLVHSNTTPCLTTTTKMQRQKRWKMGFQFQLMPNPFFLAFGSFGDRDRERQRKWNQIKSQVWLTRNMEKDTNLIDTSVRVEAAFDPPLINLLLYGKTKVKPQTNPFFSSPFFLFKTLWNGGLGSPSLPLPPSLCPPIILFHYAIVYYYFRSFSFASCQFLAEKFYFFTSFLYFFFSGWGEWIDGQMDRHIYMGK